MNSSPRRQGYFGGFTLAVIATIAVTVFLTESSPIAYASGAATAPASARAAFAATYFAKVADSVVAQASVVKTVAPKATPRAAVKRKAAVAPYKFGTKKYNLWFAQTYMRAKYKWNFTQYVCLTKTWDRESAWNQRAHNRSGAHGIPQAMPGKKMAKFGKDWRTNPVTQIKWGLNYIKHVYNSPCGAWYFWQNHQWY